MYVLWYARVFGKRIIKSERKRSGTYEWMKEIQKWNELLVWRETEVVVFTVG